MFSSSILGVAAADAVADLVPGMALASGKLDYGAYFDLWFCSYQMGRKQTWL